MIVDRISLQAQFAKWPIPNTEIETHWSLAQKQLLIHFAECEMCQLALRVQLVTFPPGRCGTSRLRRLLKVLCMFVNEESITELPTARATIRIMDAYRKCWDLRTTDQKLLLATLQAAAFAYSK